MAINDTRIKYISIFDKLYEVEHISFYYFTVEAKETDLTIDDVKPEEVFNVTDFREFKIKLHNWQGNVVDFEKFLQNRKSVS